MNKFLYIMSFVDSKSKKFYKIGISNNCEKRKTSLQKDIDFELKYKNQIIFSAKMGIDKMIEDH